MTHPLVTSLMDDVHAAMSSANPHECMMYLQRVQIAAESLMGIARKPDTGPWEVSVDGQHIYSDDFDHDVTLKVGGDFYSNETRKAYSEELASRLNAKPGMVTVPVEPTQALLESMAMRYRHDFWIDADADSPMSCGLTPAERAGILRHMRQIHEEVVGTGFYRPVSAD